MVRKRKYLLYVVGLPACTVFIFLIMFFLVPDEQQKEEENVQDDYFLRGAISNTSAGKQILEKNRPHLCGTSIDKYNEYIREYTTPILCSQPVGIVVDKNNTIWTAATWAGYLMIFDPDLERFVDFIEIPNWKTKGDFGSMVWDMEFDKNEDLWFTDQMNNAIWRYFTDEKKFEIYKVPTKGSYPASIDFDNQGRVWFSEIFGKKLALLDPDKVLNNTTNGIEEFELKLTEEEGFETMGPIIVSNTDNINNNNNNNRVVWFTAVNFPEGGHVVKFNIKSKEFEIFKLPKAAGTPVGIVEDDNGRLWINDHATNLFLMFDPSTKKVVKYSTSLPTSRNTTTTLPYWNDFRDGKVWFNEHEGNAMAYFDIANSTLVEYQIPSRGEAWGNTSNPLRFALDKNGSVWFTEWSENKIGVLDSEKLKDLPIWISIPASNKTINLDKEEDIDREKSIQIFVYPNRSNIEEQGEEPVKMTIAGSMSQSGRLWNITGEFSDDVFYFPKGSSDPQTVTLKLRPTQDLVTGNYTLTIGARYSTTTYSKIINLNIK
jgi:virginiamycin B lyase